MFRLLVINDYAVCQQGEKLAVSPVLASPPEFPYLQTLNPGSMEWFWIILGIVVIVIGIAGSLLPVLPGPPIAYIGLLLQQLRAEKPFSTQFLLIWAGIVVLTIVLDYLVPIWGTKKFGGTNYGVWGCTLGFLLAFWMGPWGVIVGPFLGAFVGELIGGQNSQQSFKAAVGSFIGFLLGSFLKLVACFMMLYYLIKSI